MDCTDPKDTEYANLDEYLQIIARYKPIAIYHHGGTTDKLYAEGQLDALHENLKPIRTSVVQSDSARTTRRYSSTATLKDMMLTFMSVHCIITQSIENSICQMIGMQHSPP